MKSCFKINFPSTNFILISFADAEKGTVMSVNWEDAHGWHLITFNNLSIETESNPISDSDSQHEITEG